MPLVPSIAKSTLLVIYTQLALKYLCLITVNLIWRKSLVVDGVGEAEEREATELAPAFSTSKRIDLRRHTCSTDTRPDSNTGSLYIMYIVTGKSYNNKMTNKQLLHIIFCEVSL